MSVVEVTATKAGQFHDWRGPLVAYGMKGLGLDPNTARDLSMQDFRHIVDYLLCYNYTPPKEMVKGVKINRLGDEKMLKKPHYEAVDVPYSDAIFSIHDTSDTTERIGLPIYTRRCPPDSRWAKDDDNKMFAGGSPFNNQDATFLHLSCDLEASFNPSGSGSIGWEWAPDRWQNSVGSVIVVRQDKKPLTTLQMEALCKYCRHDTRDLMAHSMGEYAPEEPLSKEAAMAMICRPAFIISWYRLLREKREACESVVDTYPYKDVEF